MSAVLDVTRKRTSPIEQPLRRKITITQKRWLLSAHLLCMAAWLGGGFCSLAFNIIALRTTDPHLLNATFVFAETLDTIIIRSGAVGSVLTGISLALLTQWGLFKFYWIIAKEIAGAFCIAIDQLIIRWNNHAISLTATQGLDALSDPAYLSNRTILFVGILFQLGLLLTVIVISTFKPWGQRKRTSQRSA